MPYAVWLVPTAAQRGWRSPQTQLLALSPDLDLVSIAARGSVPADHWRRLADSIDLDEWASAPSGETLHDSWAQFDLMGCELLQLLVQLRMKAAVGCRCTTWKRPRFCTTRPAKKVLTITIS